MRHLLLKGLRLAAGVVVFVGLLSATSAAFWDPRDLLGLREKVAVVEITGILSKSTPILEDIKRFREDRTIRAIVLRVNSPGGVVGPAQEIMRDNARQELEKIGVDQKHIAEFLHRVPMATHNQRGRGVISIAVVGNVNVSLEKIIAIGKS